MFLITWRLHGGDVFLITWWLHGGDVFLITWRLHGGDVFLITWWLHGAEDESTQKLHNDATTCFFTFPLDYFTIAVTSFFKMGLPTANNTQKTTINTMLSHSF